jgi:hypothetical protein
LGVLGVNLIHGAFYRRKGPAYLIAALPDELSGERGEIDRIKFSGPAFSGIDNQLMSLQPARPPARPIAAEPQAKGPGARIRFIPDTQTDGGKG